MQQAIDILMSGEIGEGLRAAAERREKFIREHGETSWNKYIEDLKAKSDSEFLRKSTEELSRQRISQSGLVDLDKMTFKGFNAKEPWQKHMLDKCKAFLSQGEFTWLYISGQVGSGKTHLGTAVCGELLSAGRPTRYTTYQQLMVGFKAVVNDDEAYTNVLREYGKCKVLYIDDFMKFRPTEADLKHTFELLNMRQLQGNITIITSEKSLNEITDIDEAIGSRIKQRCGEFVIEIAKKEGRNYRLKG